MGNHLCQRRLDYSNGSAYEDERIKGIRSETFPTHPAVSSPRKKTFLRDLVIPQSLCELATI